MTDTWTDLDLDLALADLADVVDPDPGSAPASLTAVRTRLAGADAAKPATGGSGALLADVLELGDPGAGRPPRPTRWTTGLLVAAAVVATVVLAAVLWPRAADRAAPLGPRPSSSPSVPTSAEPPSVATVEQWQARVAVPQARGANAVVLLSIVGVGGSTNISFPPVAAATDVAGRPLTLHYGWACGDPHVAPGSGDSVYALADTLNTGWSGACGSLAGGARVDTTDSVDAPTPLHRYSLQIAVANPDVVWRLVVWTSTG